MHKSLLIAGLAALAAAPAGAQPHPGTAGVPGVPHTVHGEMTFYQMNAYNGDDYTVDTPSSTVHTDWPIRSIAIHPGDRWQICGRSRYRDPCIVLDRSVPDATMVGIEDQIGSARPAPEAAPAPAPAAPH